MSTRIVNERCPMGHDMSIPGAIVSQGRCRECRNEVERRYNQVEKRREYHRQWQRGKTLEKYGITREEYIILFDRQNGRCAICGKRETATRKGKVKELAVDHDHVTGIVRGLLCQKCNMGIGQFDDDSERLTNAADYLSRRLI